MRKIFLFSEFDLLPPTYLPTVHFGSVCLTVYALSVSDLVFASLIQSHARRTFSILNLSGQPRARFDGREACRHAEGERVE